MRRLIWVLLILGVLWCAWWAIFGFGFKAGLGAWFEDRRSAGWQAEYDTLEMRGFPTQFRADMANVALADPATGLAINLPDLSIQAPAYWPGDITLNLPDTPIDIATPQRKTQILVQNGSADLKLHPGTALELEQLSLVSGAWTTSLQGATLYGADDLSLSMIQADDDPNRYAFSARAKAFQPGQIPRAKLHLPASWPVSFEAMALDGTITFSRPWDLQAIESTRPQPRVIKLKLAEAAWSDLRVFFAADLVVDETGMPTGTLNIQAENWQAILKLVQDAGAIDASVSRQIEQALGQLARLSGDPTALDVKLNFSNGYMAVGFLPIGRAPRLVLR